MCVLNFIVFFIYLKEGDKMSIGLLRISCICNGIGVVCIFVVIIVEIIERVVFGLILILVISWFLVLFCFRF